MLDSPMDALHQFPVRKTGKQKLEFRNAVEQYARNLGYNVSVEKGSLGCHNVVIGDAKAAKFLVTAHYDTCARLPFPNLITPCNLFLFLLYQIVITLVLFVLPAVPAVAVGIFAKSFEVGYLIWYMGLITELILMYVGPANKHNVNDNTSGVVTVLEIMKALPVDLRNDVCFVLFDLEEAGLIGSSSYRSTHKNDVKKQLILNLDCVGEGDEILLFPGGKARKNNAAMACLKSMTVRKDEKQIYVRDRGFSFYPSDQCNFPYGVGIAALNRSRLGLYLGRIHTPKDTILDEANVNLLCESLIKMMGNALNQERNENYETI